MRGNTTTWIGGILSVLVALIGFFWGKLQFLFRKWFKGSSEADQILGKDTSVPRSIRNNNPGNIKYSRRNAWRGKVPKAASSDPVFEQFVSMEMGARAMMKLLTNAYIKKGFNTIKSIIFRYAPPFDTDFKIDQDSQAYANFVSRETGWDQNRKLSTESATIKELAYHMARYEAGPNKAITKTKINRKLFARAYLLIR